MPPPSPLQVFYQLKTAERSLTSVLSSCGGFQKEIALAACSALTPHLAVLASAGINSLALRISTQADMVVLLQPPITIYCVSQPEPTFFFFPPLLFFLPRWSTRPAAGAGCCPSAT